MKRSMQGKPVLPMMMRKVMRIRGQTAVLKRTMESGVRVKPTSLNALSAVKMALGTVSLAISSSIRLTYHQDGLTPSTCTTS